MFDYESAAGQVFVKDSYNRLKSFNWTDTGIIVQIRDINKKMDLGKYAGEVATGEDYNQKIIEIKEVIYLHR